MYSREYLLMEDIYRAREAGRVWDMDSGSVGPREFPGCNSSTGFTLEAKLRAFGGLHLLASGSWDGEREEVGLWRRGCWENVSKGGPSSTPSLVTGRSSVSPKGRCHQLPEVLALSHLMPSSGPDCFGIQKWTLLASAHSLYFSFFPSGGIEPRGWAQWTSSQLLDPIHVLIVCLFFK